MTTIINFISGLLVIAIVLRAIRRHTESSTYVQDNSRPKYPPYDTAHAQAFRIEPPLPNVRLAEVKNKFSAPVNASLAANAAKFVKNSD